MSKPLRILIIEDSEDDTLLLLRHLQQAGYDPIHRRVETADDMIKALDDQPWDLITADHTMPKFSSTAALKILQEWNRDIPFIVVSGTIGEEAAVAAMRAGAHDYLIKGNLTRFAPAVERELADAIQRRKQRQLEWALMAQHEQLRIARDIQQGLFPGPGPVMENFDVAGLSLPAEATGGDYFDYIPMPEHYEGIVIGDITGHGLGASLLMAEMRACFRALAEGCTDISEIFTRANRLTKEDFGQCRFLTVLFARLQPAARSLVYLNAGHPAGYVLNRRGDVRSELKSSGMPLGIHPASPFPPAAAIALDPGDIVLLLTDGVLDALTTDDDPAGTEHTLELLRRHRDQPAAQIVEQLCTTARATDAAAANQDDITAVVLKAKP